MAEPGTDRTADDVLEGVDLAGRRYLVTGATGGLGLETARALARAGGAVTLTARDDAKAHAAIASVTALVPDAEVEARVVDLASLRSVRTFTDEFLAAHDHLDVLIANAGVMGCPFARTADGFELQLGTNHLGHFVLVNRLVPALVAAAPARVVMLSSGAHKMGDVDLDDPQFARTPYDKWVAYGRSKTANALFARALDDRFSTRGVRAFAVHPGMILTDLGRHLDTADVDTLRARRPVGTLRFKSIEEGAATSVWAATSPDLAGQGGVYLEDCRVADMVETPDTVRGVMAYALDAEHAEELWRWSEQAVGETFPALV